YQAGPDAHEAWFLDAVTAFNQARVAASAGARGVGVWRLGAEDPAVWRVIRRDAWPTLREDMRQLALLDAEGAVRLFGDGEILRVLETADNGVRRLAPTDSGELAEHYERYPAHYTLEATGRGEEQLIALTFDDGPDPEYTPQILDILRRR